jgi:hypothetical protein
MHMKFIRFQELSNPVVLGKSISLLSRRCTFWRYKQSGIGRENHKMMLGHYRQTKNMLISYDKETRFLLECNTNTKGKLKDLPFFNSSSKNKSRLNIHVL